jgi:hypothetical protein
MPAIAKYSHFTVKRTVRKEGEGRRWRLGTQGRRTKGRCQGDLGQHAKAFIIPNQIRNTGADLCAM